MASTQATQATGEILVLFCSQHGSVHELAQLLVQRAEQIPCASARINTVHTVSSICEATAPTIPDPGTPYVEFRDLDECIGMALAPSACLTAQAMSAARRAMPKFPVAKKHSRWRLENTWRRRR